MDFLSRTERMLGQKNIERLQQTSVLLFGLGGVGGGVLESLARIGIGTLGLVDGDAVEESNLNRQLIATKVTIGWRKTDAAVKRIEEISQGVKCRTYDLFVTPENLDQIDFTSYDYIVDCIDNVTAKIAIIEKATRENKKVISAMGAGNKLNPMAFEIVPIEKTSHCPLARVMRRELKARGIGKIPVIYSKEEPINVQGAVPGSISFVPPAAGMMIASHIVRELLHCV